jgi:hypothetical protein
MKFNKGERIVRTNHPCTNLYVGDIGKIKDIYPNTHVYIVINERNGKEQTWSEDYVEAVNPSIVIYQKGREVIASLKSGKETIKTAKAICNPSDEFDFNVGAKLAFQRLMGEDEKVAKADTSFIKLFDWQAFKSGKFAVHCDTEEKAKAFLKECDEQGIKWCTGARPIVEQKETRWNGYKERTAYGCDSFGGLCYGTHDERTKVDYQPSIPTVREVHRPAKVGEWIRVIHHASYAYGNYNIGDVIKIENVIRVER